MRLLRKALRVATYGSVAPFRGAHPGCQVLKILYLPMSAALRHLKASKRPRSSYPLHRFATRIQLNTLQENWRLYIQVQRILPGPHFLQMLPLHPPLSRPECLSPGEVSIVHLGHPLRHLGDYPTHPVGLLPVQIFVGKSLSQG